MGDDTTRFRPGAERPSDSSANRNTFETFETENTTVSSGGGSATIVGFDNSTGTDKVCEIASWSFAQLFSSDVSLQVILEQPTGTAVANLQCGVQAFYVPLDPGFLVRDGDTCGILATNHGSSDVAMNGSLLLRDRE